MRIALNNRSAGSACSGFAGGRHQKITAITPRLLTASNQNGAAIPKARMTMPARAGPMTRLMLTPTLFAAEADESAGFGTSCGPIACQAGVSSAPRIPTRKMKSSSTLGVTTCSVTSNANRAEKAVVRISRVRMKRRLSTMSARAPAGNPNKNSGRLLAT